MRLTTLQLQALEYINRVCEEYDACHVGGRLTRSVAEALARKKLVIRVRDEFLRDNSDGAPRIGVGYMMLEAGYDALGIEMDDTLP